MQQIYQWQDTKLIEEAHHYMQTSTLLGASREDFFGVSFEIQILQIVMPRWGEWGLKLIGAYLCYLFL